MGDGGHQSTHRAGSRGVDSLVWVRAMSERAEAVFVRCVVGVVVPVRVDALGGPRWACVVVVSVQVI